jgi:TPR repeat protein
MPKTTAIANKIATQQKPTQKVMLDLHGLSVDRAKTKVLAHIKTAASVDITQINFITGRGNHVNAQGKRGTLYTSFEEWIKEVDENITHVEKRDGFYEVKIKNSTIHQSPLNAFLNENLIKFLTTNIKEIKSLAAKKDFQALWALGICYDNGYDVKQNYHEATKCYLALLEIKKIALIQYEVGCRYLIGKGCRLNDKLAIQFLTQSADQKLVLAEFVLGNIYYKGTITNKPDYNLGNKYLLQAANNHHAEAAHKIGYAYHLGLGYAVDHKAAIKWYKIAVELGYGTAAFNLCYIYESGIGVDVDLEEALKYLHRSAELEDMDGQCSLGMRYYNGVGGLTENKALGLQWLLKSASNQCAKAQYFIFLYVKKDEYHGDRNSYLRSAAELGHIEAQIITLFGKYEFGSEFEKRIEEHLLSHSIEDILIIDKRFMKPLLDFYLCEDNTKKQIEKGVNILIKLGEENYPGAYRYLGSMYMEGLGKAIKPNPKLAHDYWMKGKDCAQCLCGLGYYWLDGMGIDGVINVDKAIAYFTQAGSMGDSNSHLQLGIIHHSGKYRKPNPKQAFFHFNKAIALDTAEDRAEKIRTLGYHQNVLGYAAYHLANILFKGGIGVAADANKAIELLQISAEDDMLDSAKLLIKYHMERNEVFEVYYYAKISLQLGDAEAPKLIAHMDNIINSPAYSHDIALRMYKLQEKIKVKDSTLITLLKLKTALPFFAVRDEEWIVDAVVECNGQKESKAIQQFNTALGGHGKILFNGTQRLFVLSGINQPGDEKFCLGQHIQQRLGVR